MFWHSFDIAMTRFSGKKIPEAPGMDPVSREAYSHEVISFGFWGGDSNLPEPAFYSYTFPEPKTLTNHALSTTEASWVILPTGSLAIFKYHDWLHHKDLKKHC